MAVARITEISVGSKKSFDDAVETGIKRASKTLKIVEYRVRLKVTFILEK